MAEVVTGEAVVLELPVANFPSRIAARLIDTAAQLAVLLIAFVAVSVSHPANGDYLAAALLSAYVLVVICYPTAFETASRGKTLGKLALGLRVVGDDGSPVRFRQALVRALAGVIEIWTLPPVALICSLISARGKRVGDVFAGTYVIQERVPARRTLPPAFAVVPPPLAGWAQALQVAALSGHTAEAAGSYLRRFAELRPEAREALGIQLANEVAAQVSPPPPAGTPPAAYLSAVLAVRRQQERAARAVLPQPAAAPADPAPQALPAPVSPPPMTPPGLVPPG
jgi:uncharacterized RDD family membrane protein YckC